MLKKLTITIDDQVYDGLYTIIGKRKISHFIEELVRPHVMKQDLAKAYQNMAEDEEREHEAALWSEGVIGDINDVER